MRVMSQHLEAGPHLAYSLMSVFMAGSVMVTASAGTPVAWRA